MATVSYFFKEMAFSESTSICFNGYSDSIVSSSNEMIFIYWVGAFYILLTLLLINVLMVLLSILMGLSAGYIEVEVSFG